MLPHGILKYLHIEQIKMFHGHHDVSKRTMETYDGYKCIFL